MYGRRAMRSSKRGSTGRARNYLGLLLMSVACSVTHAQNASIPGLDEQPGQSYLRAPDGSYGVESIDPFTGALKIVATDLIVPSNGGLDISITRNYVSMQKTNSTMPSYLPGRTTTGIGWDIHFGRVWRASATAGYTLPAGSNCLGVAGSVSTVDARYNPVLELPDGTRDVLVTGDAGAPYQFITRGRWIGRCLPAADDLNNGGLLVISPQGIKYTFNVRGRVASGSMNNNAETAFAYHPSKIEHPNGTSITIAYNGTGSAEFLRVDTVTHSEGQVVTFTYLEPTTLNARLDEIRLNSPSRTWSYDYAVASTASGISFHYLTDVTRPDGLKYSYEYYTGASDVARYSLKSVTTPLQATVTYTYKNQLFPRHSTPAIPIVVVGTKAITGQVDQNATWTYTYEPATSASDLFDVTHVDGPSNCVSYQHRAATTANGELWRMGQLTQKTIGSSCTSGVLRRETYTWTPQALAQQNYWSPPNVFDTVTNTPLLQTLEIEQDGTSYTSTYSDFDAYGNARHIEEDGQDDRSTDRTFHIDTTRWIVQRLEDESIASAGMTYSSPTTGGTSDYDVDREYDANGDLASESLSGAETSYDWYTSGTNRGEINTITDPDNKVVTFTNYKRGTAQNESYPETVAISRTVNNTGAIDNETDPLQHTTVFAYDNLNELIGVQTAKTTDDNFSIVFADSKRRRTMTRGTYVEERTFDGMGRLRQIKLTDTGSGRIIIKKYQRDAEGRIWRAHLPAFGAASATYEQYEYDELDRLESVTRTDNSHVTYDYLSNNRVEITNERNFVTTHTYRSYGSPDERSLIQVSARKGDTTGDTATLVTLISRNKLGQATAVTQGGITRTYRYNSRFQLAYEIDPELGTITYARNNSGHITGKTVGSAGTIIYVLDNLHRLDRIDYPAANGHAAYSVDYDFYKNNLLHNVTRGSASWTYAYDENNNLQNEVLVFGARSHSLSYTYDGRDSLARMQYPYGLTLEYAPNAFGQPTHIYWPPGINQTSPRAKFVGSIDYYPNGQIKSHGGGHVATNVGQDERLFPTTLQATADDGTRVTDLNYAYDDVGNVQAITDYRDPARSRSLTYDGVNRLRTATGPFGVGGAAVSGQFTYDDAHNLLSKTLSPQSLTYNYAASGRLDTITGSLPMSFSYDAFGNITSNGRNLQGYGVFSYDGGSNLIQVGSPAKLTYTYDGNGRIVQETRADGTGNRYSLYGRSGHRYFEEDTVNFEQTQYVYLGQDLVFSRTSCTATTDTDADGIPTCVERRMGMNPNDPADAALDTDSDGLTNLQEFQAGTNMELSDSDGDGMPDGWEVASGTDPLVDDSAVDLDVDGLTNLQEYQRGTLANDSDTDNDGLLDGVDSAPRFNQALLVPILELLLND
jgi:YD repeat-containing protein